ncbi:MAG: hypothetical protein HOW73_46500 [Polyangiaceae bacterium]|nr:hypothetical protein [Polyangiaceae bacterium]
MQKEIEALRDELQEDIAEARKLANWSTYMANVLTSFALVGGATSAAILGYAPEWPRWIAGALAILPGAAMALQGKLFEQRIHHHRLREVAYHGLLDQLVYERVDPRTVSRRRREFRERSEHDWQKVASMPVGGAPPDARKSNPNG